MVVERERERLGRVAWDAVYDRANGRNRRTYSGCIYILELSITDKPDSRGSRMALLISKLLNTLTSSI